MSDALRPTPAEVAAVRDPAAPARQAAAWTAPSADEVRRLQARAPLTRLAPRRPQSGLPLLAAAALLLASLRLFPLPTSVPAPLPVPILASAELDLPRGPLHLNADIQAEGMGALEILSAGAEGARVEVRSGAVTFDVDPKGEGRDLVVVAGMVEVRVTGTRFTVAREGQEVRVSVERGSVEVRHPEGLARLAAGESWPPPAVAVVRAPPPRSAPEDRSSPGLELFVAILDAEEQGHPPEKLLRLCKAFLAIYPSGPLRDEVLLRAGDLEAEVTGDCSAGLAYYREVMETSEALARVQRCEGELP